MKKDNIPSVATSDVSALCRFFIIEKIVWMCGLILLVPAVAGWFQTEITDIFYHFPTEIEQPSPLWSQRFAVTNFTGLALWGVWILGLIWHRLRHSTYLSGFQPPANKRIVLNRCALIAQAVIAAVVSVLTAVETLILLMDVSGLPL